MLRNVNDKSWKKERKPNILLIHQLSFFKQLHSKSTHWIFQEGKSMISKLAEYFELKPVE